MPIYEYQCIDCSEREQRVAGLEDETALCASCGGLMLRQDDGDPFTPYFSVPISFKDRENDSEKP
ncbi:MAG: hypothetical protein M0P73_20430 [Syntrophobacterales bacterium]|jgi:putative FmdB family regulatory protein|nr:hypothetical protein [Syntrophobacterales bacterium]